MLVKRSVSKAKTDQFALSVPKVSDSCEIQTFNARVRIDSGIDDSLGRLLVCREDAGRMHGS